MLKKLRILLADDEAILRLDLREMLQDAGHEVVGEAANGEEAVKLARELHYYGRQDADYGWHYSVEAYC